MFALLQFVFFFENLRTADLLVANSSTGREHFFMIYCINRFVDLANRFQSNQEHGFSSQSNFETEWKQVLVIMRSISPEYLICCGSVVNFASRIKGSRIAKVEFYLQNRVNWQRISEIGIIDWRSGVQLLIFVYFCKLWIVTTFTREISLALNRMEGNNAHCWMLWSRCCCWYAVSFMT